MKNRFFYLISGSLLLSIIWGGCMRLGPDYRTPDNGIMVPESYQQANTGTEPYDHENLWWHVFKDPELNHLVDEALRNNLDIKKATAVILEMRSRFTLTRADRFPTLGLNAQGQRQHQPVFGVISGKSSTIETDSFTLSLPASYELDLWGRLARAEEAAIADLLQVEENRHTVAQGVVAETINLYLQMEALERRIQISLLSIENFRRSLGLVERRYKRGLSTVLDLRQARRILAGAESLLPSLRQELGSVQMRLAVLLGRYPETSPSRIHMADYFERLTPVPAGLPSDLLLQRPDIRAADARLKALNARVGEARASRFPRISLTGSFGYSSEELGNLLQSGNELWNLAFGIVQPLFDAGKLKANQQAAEARYRQGEVDYAKTLLNAFSEVENALLTRKKQIERRGLVMNFLAEARATQEVAESRYARGLVDYLSVLEAQRTRFEAEENLVLVELAILTNRVSLHRALGGGWDRLTDPQPSFSGK